MDEQFFRALGRAFIGALLFALPLFMTMEMWWLGFYLEPWRIALFTVVLLPLLVGLSRYAGFQETYSAFEDVVDALVAYATGFVCCAAFLGLFAILGPGMSVSEITGKLALLAVPAGIGALLAQKQLGHDANETEKRGAHYAGELFMMAAGALFLAFNVAPTEEMILIAYKMSHWHALALLAVSLAIMHAIVYTLGFRGQESGPEGERFLRLFYRFSVVGYAIALLVSLYVLWTFGRLDGRGGEVALSTTIVLAMPAALGAALSRIVL